MTLDQAAAAAIASIVSLREIAEGQGADSLNSSCFAAILMLADAAGEDGIEVDLSELGIMGGCFE